LIRSICEGGSGAGGLHLLDFEPQANNGFVSSHEKMKVISFTEIVADELELADVPAWTSMSSYNTIVFRWLDAPGCLNQISQGLKPFEAYSVQIG
jgi:hypothetical protein